MERKTLTDRLNGLIGEREKSGLSLDRITHYKTPRNLTGLELVATALNLLPFALYSANSSTPEEGGLEEYFYGKITAQQYFSAVIETKLQERGLSQNYLAKKCKFAPSTVSMILGRVRKPGIDTIEIVTAALDLTVQYLIPKREGRPPLRLYKNSFEKVIETLQGYLIVSGDEFPLVDLHQAIEYGTRINELSTALRTRYDVLKNLGGGQKK